MRLYNQYDALTEDGSKVSESIELAIRPIVKANLANGIDGRDLFGAVVMAVTGVISEEILRRSMMRRRFERQTVRAIEGK